MRWLRAFWHEFRDFNATNVWLWQRYLSSLRPWESEPDSAAEETVEASHRADRTTDHETPMPVG
ncbi:hypothetical protein SAMN04487905_105223 [Actinopolyspora xinjiangensis]|uniref:Uncharacterized protein n=1 Tax=Actinopolyspora xinjiangensis TaxID=405564 RepID=A0A1H0TRN0_9ACTN|nr:hypothetical protein [Actinopolyspora xinjiangensis]SDP56288.1 hypothetical protein SAMN04487905_105223 [Actinopolyspora xinjiangensis]